ncbi:hypothetical protein V7O66_11635 [Methanolobus sp. ZRKC3]
MKDEENARYRQKEVTEHVKREKEEKEEKKKNTKRNMLGLND